MAAPIGRPATWGPPPVSPLPRLQSRRESGHVSGDSRPSFIGETSPRPRDTSAHLQTAPLLPHIHYDPSPWFTARRIPGFLLNRAVIPAPCGETVPPFWFVVPCGDGDTQTRPYWRAVDYQRWGIPPAPWPALLRRCLLPVQCCVWATPPRDGHASGRLLAPLEVRRHTTSRMRPPWDLTKRLMMSKIGVCGWNDGDTPRAPHASSRM